LNLKNFRDKNLDGVHCSELFSSTPMVDAPQFCIRFPSLKAFGIDKIPQNWKRSYLNQENQGESFAIEKYGLA